MKETNRKNIVDLPYSLHDARVTHIKLVSHKIVMYFNKGYFKATNNDFLLVNGFIELNDVDLDYCCAYILDSIGCTENFSGQKFSLQRFIEQFPNINFEIVDETYGYNQSKFSGYLYEKNAIKECIIEIYHFGDMKYITEV